jgi:hypothetical protein
MHAKKYLEDHLLEADRKFDRCRISLAHALACIDMLDNACRRASAAKTGYATSRRELALCITNITDARAAICDADVTRAAGQYALADAMNCNPAPSANAHNPAPSAKTQGDDTSRFIVCESVITDDALPIGGALTVRMRAKVPARRCHLFIVSDVPSSYQVSCVMSNQLAVASPATPLPGQLFHPHYLPWLEFTAHPASDTVVSVQRKTHGGDIHIFVVGELAWESLSS